MFKIAVLISGNGSNLQAIIDKIHLPKKARIITVLADNSQAYGLQRARQADIHTGVVNYKIFEKKAEYHSTLLSTMRHFSPDLIVLAGYMKILDPQFVSAYQNKILNIHPSLLPKYPGLHTHKKVLQAGDKEHGVTIHVVTEELDAGPIIAQARFPLANSDTPSTLKDKVQKIEHILYPLVIDWFITKRLEIKLDNVFLDGKPIDNNGIQYSNRELEESHDFNQI